MSEAAESQAAGLEQITIPLEKYSAQGKKVLGLAQEEARSFRHNYMGTEHILLGLLRSSGSQAAATLAALGIELAHARMAVEKIIGYGDELQAEGRPKLTPRAISVLLLAENQTLRLKQSSIGPEHILLAILSEGGGIAVGILNTLGADADKVRTQLFHTMGLTGSNASGELVSTKNNVVACRIDKRDLDAIDALIEAGIRSTRSDAAAWLIHAGIEANKTLFEKVNGTVTEIRRLRQTVQQFVQEIDQQEGQASEAEKEQNKE